LTGEGCGFDGTCCLGVLFGSGDVVGCFFMSYFGPLVVACHHVSYYCLGGCLWMMMWVSKEVVADVVVCMMIMVLWKGRNLDGGGVVRGWFTSF